MAERYCNRGIKRKLLFATSSGNRSDAQIAKFANSGYFPQSDHSVVCGKSIWDDNRK